MFKRRDKRNYVERVQNAVYPRGGWARAGSYIVHRLRRLPDPPHRIARGVAAGVFVSFSPLFGLHFVVAALVAWILRGNILAAMLATFVGNPITFPLFATAAITMGEWILGAQSPVPMGQIFAAFSQASGELWHNLGSLFTDDTAHWDRLAVFFHGVFLPYLVGGIIPGAVAGYIAYALSHPLIAAYQKRRTRRRSKRLKADRAAVPD